MLLLVVGLVVLVLVIVVVVFLSVRTMHTEDDDAYRMGAARRDTGGRNSAERDSRARRAMNGGAMGDSRRYAEAAPQPAPRARASQPAPAARRRPADDARRDPARPAATARRGGGRDSEEQRVPALPRPRGYEHDQDAGDWGGVSDEQYWAELSSDNPLATTARSAQAGPPAGRTTTAAPQRHRTAGDTPRSGDARFGDARFGDAQFGDGEFDGTVAFRDAQFGGPPLRDEPARGGTADTNDTDPGRAARAASGRGEQAGSRGAPEEPTAAWQAADSGTAAWGAQEPSTVDWAPGDAGRRSWDAPDAPETSLASGGPAWDGAAGDWRADEPSADRWAAGDEPDRRPAWDGGDPLSSASFSLPGARTAGPDQHRGDPGHDQPGPGWQNAAPASYDEPYGGHHGYPAGALEPLPDPAGRATDWHSAPVPSGNGFGAGRDGQGWDGGDSDGYGSGHDSHPAADQHDGYAGSGPDWPGAAGGAWADRDQQDWADRQPGYGQSGGYRPDQGYGHAGAQNGDGYGEPDGYPRPGSHRGQDDGYGPASHGTAAYDLPAYDTAADGHSERAGNGQPRHGYGSR